MNRILFGVIVAVASFMLTESLTCNKCGFSLLGVCLNSSQETCTNNSTVCFTARAKFSSLPSFTGFNSQGCRQNDSLCNATTTGTLLGVTYETNVQCCSTDNCNPIQLSGAPTTKMTLSAAVGAAILASMLGSIL